MVKSVLAHDRTWHICPVMPCPCCEGSSSIWPCCNLLNVTHQRNMLKGCQIRWLFVSLLNSGYLSVSCLSGNRSSAASEEGSLCVLVIWEVSQEILWPGVLGLIAQSLHLVSFLKLDSSKQLNKGFVTETTQNFGVISWNSYKLVILRVIIILFVMWL